MSNIDVYSQEKKKVSAMKLGPAWDAPIAKGAVYNTAVWQMNARRAGTASTKGRSEVRGSKHKIYRQKGTGRARHRDRQAPIFVGGGIVGGPRPRDWSTELPKKERKRALQSLLIYKLKNDRLRVLESLDFGEVKTKKAEQFFAKWNISSGLVVLDKPEASVVKSIKNLPSFKTCSADSLNVGDLLVFDYVILTKPAMEMIEQKMPKSRLPKVKAKGGTKAKSEPGKK